VPEGPDEEEDDADEQEDEEPAGKGKTKVLFIEEIPKDRFYLRVGLGRKATGSYYTPHPFVRFLVQETLGPQILERSPHDDPNPLAILGLKVLDPAMGSGHFLVEACRFLGDALYEACRLCDERALEAQKKAESVKTDAEKGKLLERAHLLWKRVEDLPDPNDELVAYLPSRVLEGDESGLSQRKALALCRRLVAVHCLYGVDKNPLAVELARVSLWLESYAEGLPLTFLEHRLICGDSLTGPFFEHLLTYPGTGERINNLFAQGVTEKLTTVLAEALVHVRDLEATIGKDAADIELKKIAKTKLDAALSPLKVLAAAWAGGVMLGRVGCDDPGYEHMLRTIAEKEDPDAPASSRPGVAEMVRVGIEGVPYDLAFPEVFHPHGGPERSGGFHVVMGNPPWDAIRRTDDQFFGAIDFRALSGATKKEKAEVQAELRARDTVRRAYTAYVEQFERQDRISDALFTVHRAEVDGNLAGRGTYDAYMLFVERSLRVLIAGGFFGEVLPSGVHANEGSTGVRRLLLDESSLQGCFCFENRRGLFEIDSRYKFAALTARQGPSTDSFACAFYLQELEWLASKAGALRYTRQFVEATGGACLAFLELRSQEDAAVAETCFQHTLTFRSLSHRLGLKISQEVNMTYDAHRFAAAPSIVRSDSRQPEVAAELRRRGYLPLHEGKTFHQFDDRWGDAPRYVVSLDAVQDKPAWTGPARFFRIAFRDIARSTDERTGIFCLLPPGVLLGNTAPVEREPEKRANAHALVLEAVADSFAFDWHIRQRAAVHVNLFIVNGCPVPPLRELQERGLAHLALRLSCNHEGYRPLWKEQLGDEWREPVTKGRWPVLGGEDARLVVRAPIDALVAAAYGLSREQYKHVLGSFSHKTYPRASELCLAAFDELNEIGLDEFVKKHDPYWDIPLVTALPKPVIDLPGAEPSTPGTFQLEPAVPKPKRGRPKKGGAA